MRDSPSCWKSSACSSALLRSQPCEIRAYEIRRISGAWLTRRATDVGQWDPSRERNAVSQDGSAAEYKDYFLTGHYPRCRGPASGATDALQPRTVPLSQRAPGSDDRIPQTRHPVPARGGHRVEILVAFRRGTLRDSCHSGSGSADHRASESCGFRAVPGA